MVDIPMLQIVGALLFAVLGIGLFAIQFDRLASYRWPIFLGCLACFAGTAIIGWLTYVPSPHGPFAIYEEIREAKQNRAFWGGGMPRNGSVRGGAQSRSGQPAAAGVARGGAASSGLANTGTGTPNLSPSGTFSDCAKCPAMVMIPAGEINIPADQDGKEPHSSPIRIRIAQDFAVSRHEISVDEFMVFAQETGFEPSDACHTDGVGGPSADFRNPGFEQTRHHPVVCISIHDARRYVAWLSARAGWPYALLSEARWEYVRLGATSPLDQLAGAEARRRTEDGNVKTADWAARTTPGGRYAANPFGVYDMMGNAAEWTAGCWHDDRHGLPSNGLARTSSGDCSAHAVRGGSWDDTLAHASPASRRKVSGTIRDWRIGFRVMRTVAEDVVASN